MTPTILLVEDNVDDAELTLRAFKRNNFANPITVARDGVEAIDYLLGTGPHAAAPPALPAVVLLDLKLPKIDGLGVLARVRASARAKLVPIVMLTSSGEPGDLVAGYTQGANSYIRKPVTFERFVEAIRTLGTYWLLLNERPPGPADEGR
jgi:two-component system response regulator